MGTNIKAAVHDCVACKMNGKRSTLTCVEHLANVEENLCVEVVSPFWVVRHENGFAITLIDLGTQWPDVDFISFVCYKATTGC